MILPEEQPEGEFATLARWIDQLNAVLAELDASGLAVPAVHLNHAIELLKLEMGAEGGAS
mgnify:CR=1 FL=1